MAILDSSCIVEILKGTAKGKRIVDRYGDEGVSTTAVTVNEVLVGAKGIEADAADRLFKELEILPLDAEAARRAARVEQELERKGALIEKMDMLIAGVCLVHDVPIITADKGFQRVAGLHVFFVD